MRCKSCLRCPNEDCVIDVRPVTAILAGGCATRLGPLTTSRPKSLVEVAGEPFIAHQLRGLARQDFRDVVICAGHLGELIRDCVGDGAAFGCRVRYSFDGDRPLGTGGALRNALPLLSDRFLTMYGDSFLRAALAPVWAHWIKSGKSALMTVFGNDNRWDRSNVDFRDGAIQSYDKAAPAPAMRHIDYGLGCIRADALWNFSPEIGSFDLAEFYRAMLAQGEMAAFEVTERFYEIGSPPGLAETEEFLRAAGQE